MQRSTLLRDLSRYLRSQASDFQDAGLMEWSGHLEEDADRLAERADVLVQDEPQLPSIESLTGILGNRDTAEPDDITRLKKVIGEVAELLESVDFGPKWSKVDDAVVILRKALMRHGAENERCPSCNLTLAEHTEWVHDMGFVSWGTLQRKCKGWPGSLDQEEMIKDV